MQNRYKRFFKLLTFVSLFVALTVFGCSGCARDFGPQGVLTCRFRGNEVFEIRTLDRTEVVIVFDGPIEISSAGRSGGARRNRNKYWFEDRFTTTEGFRFEMAYTKHKGQITINKQEYSIRNGRLFLVPFGGGRPQQLFVSVPKRLEDMPSFLEALVAEDSDVRRFLSEP